MYLLKHPIPKMDFKKLNIYKSYFLIRIRSRHKIPDKNIFFEPLIKICTIDPSIRCALARISTTIYRVANFSIRRLSSDNKLNLQGLIMCYLHD